MKIYKNINKAAEIALKYLANGEKQRNMVTSKIKNFSRDDQAEAVSLLISGGYIAQRVEERQGRGRNPVYISLTEKGIKLAESLGDKPKDKSIWSI